MAITDAQQAKQIMMQDGGVPQLVKKGKGKKRPGYRGVGGYRGGSGGSGGGRGREQAGSKGSGFETGRNVGRDPNETPADDRGTRQQNLNQQRIRDAAAQRAREKAERERKEKERIQKEIDKYNKQQAKKVRQMKRNKTLQDMLEEEEIEKQNQTLGFGDRLDKTLNKIGLGKKGYIERTKASNLKDLGMLDRKFGLPTIATGLIDAFDVPKETAMFDIDSIREIGSVLGKQKTGMTKSQSKTLGDLRQDIQVEDKYNRGTLTNQEFQDYMNRNKLPVRDNDGGGQPLPVLPPIVQPPKDDKDSEEEPFKLALAFRKDGGRVPYEDGGYTGGIMDLESGRQMYFLGKLVKKATRAVKKIVKSPVGKIGLGALMLGGAGGFSGLLGKAGGLGGMFSKIKGLGSALGGMSFGNKALLSVGGGLLAGALAGKGYQDEDGDGFDDNTGFDVDEFRRRGAQGNVPIAFRAEGGMSDVENDPQYKGWKRIFEVNPDAAEMHPKHREFVKYYRSTERETKAEGGMMDLKGMEMDFRDDGGFVPIGKKERADDVPARLSKNEFVMTADAVRGAGDGDIDKGAQKMYNLMSKLEAENDQSQGLNGARKMFKTAQRLEEVL